MTDLSPAAQAVFDAVWREIDYAPKRHVRWAAIAALRAAADQVVPVRQEPLYADSSEESTWRAQQDVREELLSIAAELEDTNA